MLGFVLFDLGYLEVVEYGSGEPFIYRSELYLLEFSESFYQKHCLWFCLPPEVEHFLQSINLIIMCVSIIEWFFISLSENYVCGASFEILNPS